MQSHDHVRMASFGHTIAVVGRLYGRISGARESSRFLLYCVSLRGDSSKRRYFDRFECDAVNSERHSGHRLICESCRLAGTHKDRTSSWTLLRW